MIMPVLAKNFLGQFLQSTNSSLEIHIQVVEFYYLS